MNKIHSTNKFPVVNGKQQSLFVRILPRVALSPEIRLLLSSRYREGSSHQRFTACFREERAGEVGQSDLATSAVFSKLLLLKIVMPRCQKKA